MLKLFRYLKKAYVPVIAIVLLLILQASCDLTLPTFTSNIVNVGIQQKGIEDAVPDVMREETFLALKSLMKQDDADDMEDAYKLYTKDQVKDSKYKDYKDGRLYVRRYISKKDREHLDTSMSKAMLKLSAQMAKQIHRCKVFSASVLDATTSAAPGTILAAGKEGIQVACGGGTVLRIDELQADGGKRMKAADYLRGHPIPVG